MNAKFFSQTLPVKTAQLLSKTNEISLGFLTNFYLSGGTALSLQLGHRESEDLDFFSGSSFDPRIIQVELEKIGQIDDLELAENTLNGYVDGVKLQFLGYPYPLLEPTIDYQGIKLSSVLDIACTKLQTIGMRGSKKDFIDMYVLMQKYPLSELLEKMKEKYKNSEFNIPHILKSLVYFADAEDQVMPRLHTKIEWNSVKARMTEVVKEFKIT
ncbi:MAG: nucleotidyl transferase AbiEii/AbiGii toxin family protein [bacterium]